MMGRYKFYFVLLVVLLTATPIYYTFSFEISQQKKEIAQFIYLYYKMLDNGNLQTAYQMMSKDFAGFSMDEKELSPLSELSNTNQSNTSHHIYNMDIRIVGNSAIVTNELVISINQSTQNQGVISKFVVTSVLECTNEQWKIVHLHHTNTQ